MKKTMKRIGKVMSISTGVAAALLCGTAIYHHASLSCEADDIIPNGKRIEVNGHNIHMYSEGEKGDKPTLVFMSGSATVAPVYDFKSLYSLLSDEYRIAVVEKAGYGYSDICETERDIDSMLNEIRQALSLAGESGPYVLFPHSMSGLEAIYWAQRYPGEVAAIVGLDMAVPESYDSFDASNVNLMMYAGGFSVWLGLHRIPGIYPLDTVALTESEIRQQKLLMYRNAVNIDYVLEGKAVCDNAEKVKAGEMPELPILMFVSDGKEIGDFWIPCQNSFAAACGARLVQLDCGHYVHHYEADFIAEEAKVFLSGLE